METKHVRLIDYLISQKIEVEVSFSDRPQTFFAVTSVLAGHAGPDSPRLKVVRNGTYTLRRAYDHDLANVRYEVAR